MTPVERLTTDLLAFAEIEPVTVAAIAPEVHLAEKLHAYTRTYEGERSNSRAKDLVDLALITERSPLNASALRDAIHGASPAGTHAVPASRPRTGASRSASSPRP